MRKLLKKHRLLLLCSLMLLTILFILSGCATKETSPKEFFTMLDSNETTINKILLESSKNKEYFVQGQKDGEKLGQDIKKSIEGLEQEKDEKLAAEVKALLENEQARANCVASLLKKENIDENITKCGRLYGEFEAKGKAFREKYQIQEEFTFIKEREAAKKREEEARRKAREERAKRIAANKRDIIAYEKGEETMSGFPTLYYERWIPTNTIRKEDRYMRYVCVEKFSGGVGNVKLMEVEIIIDYQKQRLMYGEQKNYDANGNLIRHWYGRNKWRDFSLQSRDPLIRGYVKKAEEVRRYLMSIDEWPY